MIILFDIYVLYISHNISMELGLIHILLITKLRLMGEDSVLPLQSVGVQPLVRELRSHVQCSKVKKKKYWGS